MKCIKIIEVTNPIGLVHYELERLEKDWLGRWEYKAICHSYGDYFTFPIRYKTKEEAINEIPFYDGTVNKRKIVYSNF